MNRCSLPLSVNTLKKWWESEEETLKCSLPFQRHAGMWNIATKLNILASGNRDSGVVETYIPDTETAFDWLNYHL